MGIKQVGDPTLADAILDRLVHNAHKLHLKENDEKNKSEFDLKNSTKVRNH